jgi:hypothetical protein
MSDSATPINLVDFFMDELRMNNDYYIFREEMREFIEKMIEDPTIVFKDFDETDTIEFYKAMIKVKEVKLERIRDEKRIEFNKRSQKEQSLNNTSNESAATQTKEIDV